MSKLLKITSGSEDVLLDDLYYKKGDTYEYNTSTSKIVAGYVTTSAKACYMSIWMPKRVPSDITLTLSAFVAIIRTHNGNYLDHGSSSAKVDWMIGYDTKIVSFDENFINVGIEKSSAFTDVTNNTPVVVSINKMIVTFS